MNKQNIQRFNNFKEFQNFASAKEWELQLKVCKVNSNSSFLQDEDAVKVGILTANLTPTFHM